MIAVDFSDQHPSIAVLQANNVNAVGRYIGCPAPKGITLAELETYRVPEVGIVPWFVFEDVANDPNQTDPVALAQSHAEQVLDALTDLKLPGTQPVYYNAGDDSLTWENSPGLGPYFTELQKVYVWAPDAVGAYGNGQVLSFLLYCGLAHYAWQSSSASYPDNAKNIPQANIRQVPPAWGTSPIPGTDLDYLLKADIGQYPRPVAT
jgi:hypothetical protein